MKLSIAYLACMTFVVLQCLAGAEAASAERKQRVMALEIGADDSVGQGGGDPAGHPFPGF